MRMTRPVANDDASEDDDRSKGIWNAIDDNEEHQEDK